MFADNDPGFSPLWAGRRAPFHAFQTALGGLAGAYDVRDTRSNDPMTRVSLSVDDWNGTPITAARLFPVAAFDDLVFAVQQLRDRRQAENREFGWTDQVNADRRAARLDRWQARGADMDDFRAGLRRQFSEAAHRTEQPAMVIGRPARPGETPTRKAMPTTRPSTGRPAPSKPRS